MVKNLAVLLAVGAMGLGGCHLSEYNKGGEVSKWGAQRFGFEPQVYHIKEINSDFEVPNIQSKWGAGFYVGREFYPASMNGGETGLRAGFDLRFNLDKFGESNRNRIPGDYGDCLEWGELSFVGQGFFSGIPFIGVSRRVGGTDFYLDYGLPLTRWEVKTGDTSGGGCFDNVVEARETDIGQKIRFGFNLSGRMISGGYISLERYRNSLVDVDAISLGISVGF